MMEIGTPCRETISLMYNLVRISMLSVARVGMKYANLVRRSTMTQMEPIYKVFNLQALLRGLSRFRTLLGVREEDQPRWGFDPGKLLYYVPISLIRLLFDLSKANLELVASCGACPHHGFSELHQLDTFYSALNVNDQDSLNSAAGGNFLDKITRECLKIIESKSKVHQSRAKAVIPKVSTSSSTPAISSEVAELKDVVRALLLDKKNQSSAPVSSSTPAPVKAVEPNSVTCGGSGTLSSNTITNPKEELKGITTQSGVAYQGPTIPTQSKVVKQGTKVTKDQVQTPSLQSTAPVQPLVAQPETQTPVSEPVVAPVSAPMPNVKYSIPYPLRRDNERRRDQANEQIEKFYEIFKDMSFEISFTDALILMPKFASTLKALIGNKEKLSEMARTSMNEHYLASCLMLILEGFPFITVNTKEYHSECSGNYHKDNA
nr:reverse transcriptase domain-containing protein [Tanacetum cinerariifolium]